MRIAVSLFAAVVVIQLSACASGPTDQGADATPRDRTITTGSNIPRKGQAVIVEPSTLDAQRNGSNGALSR